MKRKPIIFTIILAALGGVIWTACQKSDVPGVKTADDRAAEKFFTSYTSSKPAVTALQQYAQRENNRLPFVKQMMKKAGIPRWDKAVVFENVKITGRGNDLGENTTVMHVPMVPENGNMVQGSLMVRMSPEDTVMNLVAAQDYASYGFGAAPAGGWNAHDVFTVLTSLDNMVFGRTVYRVTDGRVMGGNQNVNYKVTIGEVPPDQTLAELFVTLNVCHSQTVCVIAGEPGTSSGVCSTYTYCTTYYIEIAGGGTGGGGGGTGGGGGPTGGGGTGGTGGPVGWEDWEDNCITEDVFNSVVASGAPTSINQEIATLSATATTKTKKLKWKFYAIQSPLCGISFSSTEIATLEETPLYIGWRFTNLTHSNINKSGTSILWTANCNNLVATPIIYDQALPPVTVSWARMHLNYDITIGYICDAINLETNKNENSENLWNGIMD